MAPRRKTIPKNRARTGMFGSLGIWPVEAQQGGLCLLGCYPTTPLKKNLSYRGGFAPPPEPPLRIGGLRPSNPLELGRFAPGLCSGAWNMVDFHGNRPGIDRKLTGQVALSQSLRGLAFVAIFHFCYTTGDRKQVGGKSFKKV